MDIFGALRSWLAGRGLAGERKVDRALERMRLAIGRTQAWSVRGRDPMSFEDTEFSVFSQWGEDGIIQYLIHKVPIARDTFVEIGVEDYTECNTRFLLCNDNWEGLIIDSGNAHIRTINRTGLRWKHRIEGVSTWVTRENINDVLEGAGATGDVGLFSLDIDGNDFWILDAISVISPRIIIAEYNSLFGPTHAVTIPYRPDFDRTRAHSSWLYYGASLAALHLAVQRKGYQLVGSNRMGSNAFFVRSDVAGDLPDLSPEEAYIQTRIREARDTSGRLSYVDIHTEGLRLIANLPLHDVIEDRLVSVREIFAVPRGG